MPAILTPQQEQFARLVAIGHGKKHAAVLAGYSSRSAGVLGSELSARPHVRERIEELRQIANRAFDALPVRNTGGLR